MDNIHSVVHFTILCEYIQFILCKGCVKNESATYPREMKTEEVFSEDSDSHTQKTCVTVQHAPMAANIVTQKWLPHASSPCYQGKSYNVIITCADKTFKFPSVFRRDVEVYDVNWTIARILTV
ncbi:hypothetical protein AVEN_250517-1 [Araneus ventricosus]|uniref:Uncharacterized protein n=1 Tax=Araneus ventricosus TaxID=182803 RepID=A0A4Y2DL72_ARAVE|nr:hypothetical protein AVEN_250517-1 [Araneus ventricosus]